MRVDLATRNSHLDHFACHDPEQHHFVGLAVELHNVLNDLFARLSFGFGLQLLEGLP